MKRISLISGIFLFFAALVTFTSCEDPTTGPTANPPILELRDDGNGSITNDVDVAPETVLTFSVEALMGDSPLNNVRFLEDGNLVADYSTRITIGGSSATSANVLLFDTDKTSFTWEVTWVAQADESSKTYAIEVIDEAGNSDVVAVNVNTVQAFPGPISLTIANVDGSGCFLADATDVAPDSWFCVNFNGVRASSTPLATFTVSENGTVMTDLTRLEYNGVTFDANPLTIPAEDVDGFLTTVRVKAPATEGASSTFSFAVDDVDGGLAATELMVTTSITVLPPDINELTGVLLNASGPAGTGGLDLEVGASTASNDPTADIKDSGIDIALPNATNWLQQIQPSNGAVLTVAPTLAEFPTAFDDIQYQSEINDAYNLSSQVSISPVVNIGDAFLVNDGTNIFYIQCTNKIVTASDNTDSYTFSVKY